jgi:hypothetical protein
MQLPRSAPPRHQGAHPADPGRFSPLNAPQRALVDAFLAEARPWAMRQARRSFRHLPAELHEQSYENAALTLRTREPSGLDRRALYADLARHLDDELRRIHVGWCLNQAKVPTQAPPSETGPSVQQPIASFVEDGLGGLERAVLQLELGAGRDTSTARAALRLGPGQYARHREMGLGKLRGAITGSLRGRVCHQHLDAVTLAATGDRGAADRLASGPERCRSCAREASGLRRVLQQRLALAPWPFVIKPAGAIAAKLGALGAVVTGKGTIGAGLGTGFAGAASGAKVVTGLVAAAAIASGGIAAVESEDAGRVAAPAAQAAGAPATTAQAASGARATVPAAGGTAARKSTRRAAAKRRKARRKQVATAATAAAQADAQAQHPTSPEPVSSPAEPKLTDTVRETVDGVRKTVDDVTGKVAPSVRKVDEIVPGVDKAVDNLTGTVGNLLTP